MAEHLLRVKLQAAKRYKQQGNYHQAEQELMEALEVYPDNASLLVSLADVYYHQKRYQEAERLLKQVLQHQPNHPFALYLSGLVAYRQNRFAEAREYFQAVLHLNPDHLSSQKMLGILWMREKKWDRALRYFQKALELAPNDSFLLAQLARVYQERGEFRKALDLLQKVESTGEGTEFTRRQILELKAQLAGKTPEEVSQEVEQILTIPGQRERVELWQIRAESLRKAGKLEQAVEAYRQALRLDPENDYLRKQLGFLYKKMGRDELAEEYLVPIFLKTPEDPFIRNTVYSIYRKRNDLMGWISLLQEALRVHPEQKQLYGILRKFRSELDALHGLKLTARQFEAEIQTLEYVDLPFQLPDKDVQPFHKFFIHMLRSREKVFPFQEFEQAIRQDPTLARRMRKKWTSEYFRSLYQFWMFWVHFYLLSREFSEIKEVFYRYKQEDDLAPVSWMVRKKEIFFQLLTTKQRRTKEVVKHRKGWVVRVAPERSWQKRVGNWQLAGEDDLQELFSRLPD